MRIVSDMIKIAKASELDFNPRPQMGMIFTNGFYQWLKYFSKDKEKLAKALAHIFDLDMFFVALDGEKIASITAGGECNVSPIKLDPKELCKHLGAISGRMAKWMLAKHLVNIKYPFEVNENMGSISFVATSPEYRGKSIGQQLIAHIMENSHYAEYVLEVADNNASAIRLYEKLGFSEFARKPAPKASGFNYLLYMKRVIN